MTGAEAKFIATLLLIFSPFFNIQDDSNSSDKCLETNQTQEPSVSLGDKRPFTILVEGNVGSGKTTLLKYFQKRLGSTSPNN